MKSLLFLSSVQLLLSPLLLWAFQQPQHHRITSSVRGNQRGSRLHMADAVKRDSTELKKCLYREYTSFFAPMEKQFYDSNVKFIDPLNNIEGIDNYQKNVDMLAGRTSMGKLLFKDASIVLHNIKDLPDGRLQTRWTLQVTVKFLPWQPRPRFTGVSIYTLDANGKVQQQEDYWDSINLNSGQYRTVGRADALGDFYSQCKREDGAEMSAPELPVSTAVCD